MLIPRDAEPLLRRLAGEYPVVAITGPRQSGKTTLARQVFAERPYRNLERPDVRQFAAEDPRGFLAELAEGGLIDEVQRVPELLSWLQDAVDADPRPGRFVLTGSQQFGLRQGLSQSVAGRVALLELLPFSACELARGGCLPDSLDALLLKGAYPPVHDRGLEGPRWYGNYVATYLERDVRNLVSVRDLTTFQRFLQRWLALDPGARGVVIHGGTEPQRRSDLTVLPWRHLARADAWEEELRPA